MKSLELPDLIITREHLAEIAHEAATNAVLLPKDLTHTQIQAFIHLQALHSLLKDYGITPNFEIDKNL